ncbi:alcohol oxidase [Panus rudis PR-1116 ss-1]|nr:alcohol oxidase [Panus rudis PR-1116 ss-1]
MKSQTRTIAIFCSLLSSYALQIDPNAFSRISFDYIVVGGGNTGLGVAAKLSDDPRITVGVIEAGPSIEDDKLLIPGLAGATMGDSTYDWMFSTSPQTTLGNRTIALGRGKMLGGTAGMNAMGYTRASKNEYDGWGALGNKGWNFADSLSFMKKAEKWTPPDNVAVNLYGANNDPENHGTDGSIHTTSHANYSDLIPSFLSTMESLGVPRNKAALGGNNVGVLSVAVTADANNRTRSWPPNGYYAPRQSRKNLIILTGAHVSKIQLSGDKDGLQRATAVEYITGSNQTFKASVKQDIVLSAGAVNTPQLLELSGIGNATLLKKFGIHPVIDLPGVGDNLQDHPGVTATFETLGNYTTYDELNIPQINAEQMQLYLDNRTGLLSGAPSTAAFIPLRHFVPEDIAKQLKSDLDAALKSNPQFQNSVYSLQRAWLDDHTIPQMEVVFWPKNVNPTQSLANPGKRYYTFNLIFQHAWSRGQVHITSADPFAAPLIDPRYLDSPGDIDRKILTQALRFVLNNVTQAEPLRSLTLGVIGLSRNPTEEEFGNWLRDNVNTNWHLSSTAAMLPREEGGVVDYNLKVYGTSNLRVADASIFPLQIATHPMSTLYGIGEKAAELLRAGH